MHLRFLILFWCLLSPVFNPLNAQYKTEIFSNHIKTLTVYREGWNLSEPVINLNGRERILIGFDDLKPDEMQYSYKVVHCDANWEKSLLASMEYLQGFSENYLDDYEYSFNTNINFAHYKVTIPNDDMRLTRSGNYALVVYESGNPDNVVCTACFYVVDQQVRLEASVDYNTMVDIRKTTQQVNFNVLHPNYIIQDPFSETFVVVKQNNREDNAVKGVKPTFTRSDALIYEENAQLIFKGGSEYRHFDAVSTRYFGEGIQSIDYYNPYYHFTLVPDEWKKGKSYQFKNDLNGRFFIRRQEAEQEYLDLESDYIFVHFTIPMEDPFLDGEVFLNGDFTYQKLDNTSKMVYNFDTRAYEGTYLLKQGYYNYRYLFRLTGHTKTQNPPIENDYYETENDYTIFFYHRPMSGRYDKLIGYLKFNTVKRL